MNNSMHILGIDPGLASLGWGVIRIDENNKNHNSDSCGEISHVAHGVIKTMSTDSLAQRLLFIEQSIDAIFSRYTIYALAYERQFFVKNVTSGMQVANALGVILLYAAKQGLVIESFTPKAIKLQVTGEANAKKDTVEKFLCHLLGMDSIEENHASDALGAAVSFFYKKNSKG